MSENNDNQQLATQDLEARIAKLEAKNRGARWWKRGALVLLAAVLFAPFATKALGPVPNTFTTGGTISASEMNENFTHLQDGITAVEGQVPPTTCASGQVPSWDGSAWVCADDGMLTTTDPNLTISAGEISLAGTPDLASVDLGVSLTWNNSPNNGNMGLTVINNGTCDASTRGRVRVIRQEDAGTTDDIVDSLCLCSQRIDRTPTPNVTTYRWHCFYHDPS